LSEVLPAKETTEPLADQTDSGEPDDEAPQDNPSANPPAS
jgi:hypothetical protein